MKRLRLLMTRGEIVPERLAGATAVVVGVFLATTLLTALKSGARGVFPVASLEEAEGASELVPELVGGRLLNASGIRHRALARPVT